MVSVCMATFNGERFLVSQIVSILSQLGNEDELIISDDGSTDNTLKIIESINDGRIRQVDGDSLRNPARNFERALRQAKGEYIFLSDQDDVWMPNRVAVCMQLMQHHGMVVTDCSIIDDDGKTVHPSYFALRNSAPGFFHNLKKNTYLGACMSFRREVLNCSLPFPKGVPMHDIWLGLVAECTTNPVFLPEVTVGYRRHGSNVTVAPHEKSRYNFLNQFLFRWWMMKQVPGIWLRKRKMVSMNAAKG